MADWVCTKTGEEKKGESKKEMEKERKWKHVCKKTHQGDKMGIVHILKQKSSPRSAAFVSKGQEKLNSQSKKKIGEVGIYRYEYI